MLLELNIETKAGEKIVKVVQFSRTYTHTVHKKLEKIHQKLIVIVLE